MKRIPMWATAGVLAFVLVLAGGRAGWCDPDDELGGGEAKEPPPGSMGDPTPPDELGGGTDPKPGDGGVPRNPTDELGGGEEPPPQPPAEPPKPPPVEPPKAPPDAPPADDPPPPIDPDPKPAANPPDGSVDAALAAKAAAKAEEDQLKPVIAEFTKKMRKNDPQEQMSALTDISSIKHRLVAEALVPWIQPAVDPRVRSLALECAKSQRFPEMGRAAASLLDKNATDIKYARALITIMGRSKDKAQVTKLRAILKSKEYTLELQKEALTALGQIGSRDAIPDLIRMYKEFENPHLPPKDLPRKNALEKLNEEALDLITGTHMMDGKGWDRWWKDNEKTFQMPVKDEAPK
ncbi:MAG: HEAT repeat domain-containing protein [Planctomycetes bacterium]|nr:HEAT repeat domain-containing protein [Planctomycetota bacterium]